MSAPEPTKIDSLIGQVIDGRYRISRQIAVGGMGVVYEAKHAKIGRSVAVKVLHREMAGDTEVVGRFLNEARAMGTIGHPNIVACTDFGELPGNLPYLVLEYLEGRTLGEDIATSGPMEVPRALRLAVQVASALEAAHARGVIHRDLTSGNVFLTKAEGDWENAKVLDFGISKFLTATDANPKTRRGFTMGTPEFMAPEQITHPDVVDARVDIYALGVILYHMLSGKTPFGGAGVAVQTLFLQVVNELPPHIERTDIPAEVLALLDKAMSKDPYDRFPDMRTMGAALEALAPPPVMSGTYSGRVEIPGSATGSRPVLKLTTMTGRQVGPKSGAYVAATRTSLVEMAAAKAAGGEAPKSRRPLVLGALGLVAAIAVAGVLVGRGQKAAPPPTAPAGSAATPGAATARPVATGPVKLEVVSSTPSARVTFRGHAHSVPFSDKVDADSKLEIVEVTAPGREGRRFWLTIDHPMKLSVDLTPGRGVIEATTEEALVALGEREAEPAPAPGAPQVADTGGGKHSHRTNMRGKVAVASPSPSASAAAAAARKTAPTSASPASEPAPAPVVKAPEPVAATPPPPPVETPPPPPPVAVKPPPAPAPVKPAPAPAPVAAHPAAAPAHPVVAAPTIDSARAQAVFGEHATDVQRCHQRAKIDNSDIRGKLTMKISISTSGQVTATNIDASTLHSSALEACIASAVKTWTFPAAAGGTATISHVFVLR
jgi:serine/threonine-protein kinase